MYLKKNTLSISVNEEKDTCTVKGGGQILPS